jgi:hypothetical protein
MVLGSAFVRSIFLVECSNIRNCDAVFFMLGAPTVDYVANR